MDRRRGWAPGLALLLLMLLMALPGCEDSGNPPAVLPFSPDGGEDGGLPDGGAATDGSASNDLLPPDRLCREGETRCWDREKVASCLTGGTGWLVEPCGAEEFCLEEQGRCVRQECEPGQVRCAAEGEAIESCDGLGLAWSEPAPCREGEGCVSGVCVPRFCEPGETLCGRDRILTCRADGVAWEETPCPERQVCFDGQCVACVRDADCRANGVCVSGQCQPRPLAVFNDRLPDGMIGEAYIAPLEVLGGVPPYRWSLGSGELPPGLTIQPVGRIEGTPELAGEFRPELTVTDSAQTTASKLLLLRIHATGLTISTEELPAAEEGTAYSAQLAALGGQPPYGWMVARGELPEGLTLSSAGRLAGTPAAVGEFPLTIKVFDNAVPPQMAQRDFTLAVGMAPLEIVGDQSYNLFLVQVVVLPMITVVQNIPIPYSTQLQAKGGLRPYQWVEEPVAEALRPYLPRAGLPEGLTLSEAGVLSGSVSSIEQVISLTIPFTEITLSGFWFTGEVTDSQRPAQSKSALFMIPALPLGGDQGGGQ